MSLVPKPSEVPAYTVRPVHTASETQQQMIPFVFNRHKRHWQLLSGSRRVQRHDKCLT